MSLPSDPLPTAATQPVAQNPGSRRRLVRRWVYLILLAAVVGPCLVIQTPAEIGRWKVAQAVKLRKQGKTSAAYDKLEVARQFFPDSPQLLLQRAEWQLADGKRQEALADCDQMLKLGGEELAWLMLHAQFMWEAAEFGRAVEDWKQINAQSERTGRPARETALNGLAYAQALAKVELEDALAAANQALNLEPGNPAILDTRGYILHLLGRHEEALSDLDQAVKGMDLSVNGARRGSPGKTSPPGEIEPSGVLETLRSLSAPRSANEEYAAAARNAAVGHYHRALVLAALDRQDEADAALAIARQLLGREPDETLY